MRRSVPLAALAMILGSLTVPTQAHEDSSFDPLHVVERYESRPAGVERTLTLYYGPFSIPPGHDRNQVTLDVPVHGGFYTAIEPNLVTLERGVNPSEQHVHIHHAHWFRLLNDQSEEDYDGYPYMSWVFGTGEERTGGSLHDRADADPDGPRYGMFIKPGQPQALIFMLHNKTSQALTAYITLEVDFVYGSAQEIEAATSCGTLAEGEKCLAGNTFRSLHGRLWGTTFDVPRQAIGDAQYIHPVDIPAGHPSRRTTDGLGRFFTAPWSGTIIAGAGHLHPNGKEVVIANLGPAGSGCEADLDGDGYPGTTLLHSRKVDSVAEAWPTSEDYQMRATKPGFRAPIRLGDRITQFGLYKNDLFASYEAMSYVGIYVDREQVPAALPETGCTAANMGSHLIDDPLGDPREGILTREDWGGVAPDPHCGVTGYGACDKPWTARDAGLETDTVHIGGFVYTPGDLNGGGMLGAPPRVKAGTSLRFVNEDAADGMRHTVTSCNFPCNGTYTANYPGPNGLFDSGKLGNLDYIDGGITGDDTVPVWYSPTTLSPGLYTYFCRVHPTMRGAFEVIA